MPHCLIEGQGRVVRPWPWPWPRGQIFWPWPCLEAFGLDLVFLALALLKAKVKVTKILKESSINIGICETFLFSLHHEYLM